VTFYSERLLGRAGELGLTRRGMQTIYPPVSTQFSWHDEEAQAAVRESLGITNRHLLVNVKRLHPLAGQRFLVEAMNEVIRTHPDTRLVFAERATSWQTQAAARRRRRTSRHVAGLVDSDRGPLLCRRLFCRRFSSAATVDQALACARQISATTPEGSGRHLQARRVHGRASNRCHGRAIVAFLEKRRPAETRDTIEREFAAGVGRCHASIAT
jgi:hypothetical protein